MTFSLTDWIINKVGHWLLKNEPPHRAYLCDFQQITREVMPGDVLLIEGRNRVSSIISQITRSPWSHAALYAGRLSEIPGKHLQETIKAFSHYPDDTQVLIETEVGEGTIASPITKYKEDHIRILRPQGLDESDIQRVIAFAVGRLGKRYNMRHIFDLARFLFPWSLFPRKWRSSLFQHNALKPTEDICSSMIADAFHSVDFPILPLVKQKDPDNLELVQRNPRLFTPSDFDYSPYFNVIKYPIFKLGKTTRPRSYPGLKTSLATTKKMTFLI